MKKLALTALVLFFGALLATDTNAQQKFSRVVTDATRWDPITFDTPKKCTGTPQDCALKMMEELNISVGDEPGYSVYRLGEIGEKNVTVVFVSHLVEDDDSVIGILYRLELSLGDVGGDSYNLDALGRMYQCLRGPIGWRKTLCP